jgi:mono/diheme cytochrome c family protein
MTSRNILTIVSLIAALAIIGAAQVKVETVPPKAVPADQGKTMFMEYCAPCHGTDGKGHGPAASALKKAPADLTQLASHSSDGKFPGVRVSQYIQGDDAVQAHGTRDMPMWGDVFRSTNRLDQATPILRVANLTDYVKSIQAK